jgi:hypothetical protein
MKFFTEYIMPQFEDEVDIIYSVPLPGASDIPEANVEHGFMSMSR